MIIVCDKCGMMALQNYVREETDAEGRRWEVYRCIRCKREIKYAVE